MLNFKNISNCFGFGYGLLVILINAKLYQIVSIAIVRYGLLVILINAKPIKGQMATEDRYGLLVILINAKRVGASVIISL